MELNVKKTLELLKIFKEKTKKNDNLIIKFNSKGLAFVMMDDLCLLSNYNADLEVDLNIDSSKIYTISFCEFLVNLVALDIKKIETFNLGFATYENQLSINEKLLETKVETAPTLLENYFNSKLKYKDLGLNFYRKLFDLLNYSSIDETRYYLNGICYNVEKQKLEATDGHRLLSYGLELSDQDSNCIIPNNLLKFLSKIKITKNTKYLISFFKEDVAIKINEETVLLATLVEGNFPNTDKIYLPCKDYENSFSINRQSLHSIIKTLKPFFKKGFSRGLRFKINNNSIVINPTSQPELQSPLTCESKFTGEIGLDIFYLETALNTLKDEKNIKFFFNKENQPVYVEINCNLNLTGLQLAIMPIRLN